jgi:hypothetical protein
MLFHCQKLALQIRKKYMQVIHHTIFATGPLVPSYATAFLQKQDGQRKKHRAVSRKLQHR